MVNVMKLKGCIVERGLTLGKLSEITNIERSCLYRRMAGNGKDFTIEEATAISEALKLSGSEVNEIFFARTIA